MTVKDLLIHEIDAMSDLELAKALDVIRSLRSIPNRKKIAISQDKKAEFIRSLRGKYAHLQTSSELFAQRKQEEIDWEDRNR
jgi:hypothetical protein